MQPKDATNLWHGIRDGLKLFKDDEYNEKPKRIPALMVLTDGCPNHMFVPHVQSFVFKLTAESRPQVSCTGLRSQAQEHG